MRSQMLYPNRRFEIWQVWMFVKQRRKNGWSSYLPGKKYIYPKGKIVKSLHHLCSMSVKTFLSMHLYTLQQHAFINALHWRVIGNLSRTNVCQTASKTQLKQLLAHCTNWTTKKCYYIHCTMKKHAKFYFRMKNPQKTWFAQKNNAKFYLHVAWAFSKCQLLDAEMYRFCCCCCGKNVNITEHVVITL